MIREANIKDIEEASPSPVMGTGINVDILSQGFHNSGGAKKAADEILKICSL